MVAVITGDIIASKQGEKAVWHEQLQSGLSKFGQQPHDWDIYRGDSFQLAVAADQAFYACLYLKACLRALKLYDVRIAIGIAEQKAYSGMVKEADGPAFYRSGEAFDAIKKQRLVIKTTQPNWDEKMNLMFKLAMLTADQWSPVVAETIKITLENLDKSQVELAALLQKSQSVISETLKRGGFDEMLALDRYFRKEISTL